MGVPQYFRFRRWLTAAVTLAQCAHLTWEQFNGGIVSHHLLNRADLPAVSNAWGLVLLPALTWFLSGLALKRGPAASRNDANPAGLPAGAVAGFAAALALGIALSACFTYGYETAASVLFFGTLVLALLSRVYRAECVLGFVLGMTFTFGAVLPTLIASAIAAVSAAAHLLLWRPLARLAGLVRQRRTGGA